MMSKDLYEIYDDRYIRNCNTGSYLIFYLTKGVSIEIPIKHVFEKLGLVDATLMSFDDFLCFEFPSIRFNVTGDGLEHLRINNFDVEKRLFYLHLFLVPMVRNIIPVLKIVLAKSHV